MKIISTVKEMQAFYESVRVSGKTISFVPTMGFLHRGHLSLMEDGRRRAESLSPEEFGRLSNKIAEVDGA